MGFLLTLGVSTVLCIAQAPAVQAPAVQAPAVPALEVQEQKTPAIRSQTEISQKSDSETTPPLEQTPQQEESAAVAASEPPEKRQARKLGGWKLFRFGIAPKIGYTNGTSQRDGLFDKDKSIADSVEAGEVVISEGDSEDVQFGGAAWGFEVDLELVGINFMLDFHQFFNQGGMWSVLLGYDHEFGLGKKKDRLRLDLGAHAGMMRVFMDDALANLYYDSSNPAAINIATAGMEFRAMLALQIRLVGPLFTGPTLMGGYHYLWSATVDKATEEKGLHYSAAWTLRLDFGLPRGKLK